MSSVPPLVTITGELTAPSALVLLTSSVPPAMVTVPLKVLAVSIRNVLVPVLVMLTVPPMLPAR